MSNQYIPINAVSLQLTAYATSGLPVTYRVLTGSDNVTITQSGEFYYINPVQLGYATIVAFQLGSSTFAPAIPVVRVVRVIGLPDDLNVDAKVLSLPDHLSNIEVNVLEPPVEIIATLDTVPLEPSGVKISDQTPKSPIFVKVLFKPNDLISITAYDYNNRPAGYPNGQPSITFAGIVEPTDSPVNVIANQLATPSINYVINITRQRNIEIINDEATVDTQGIDANDLWDLTNNELEVVALRNAYLTTTEDSHGLKYNPLWQFSSRPSLQRTSFYYENLFYTSCNGKYQKESTSSSIYDTRWKEVGSTNPKYIHFISFNIKTHLIDLDALESSDGVVIGLNAFSDLEESLYQSGHLGITNFQNWVNQEIYENYVPSTLSELGTVMKFGAYVFSYDSNPVKSLNLNCIVPYAGGLDAFEVIYPTSEQMDTFIKMNVPSKAQRSLGIIYERSAGDVMGAYNKWDINFNKYDWSPSMPVPFEETYINSYNKFGVNPYAIVGNGISLYTADIANDTNKPSLVTTTEL